jgi:hypothetical protein
MKKIKEIKQYLKKDSINKFPISFKENTFKINSSKVYFFYSNIFILLKNNIGL